MSQIHSATKEALNLKSVMPHYYVSICIFYLLFAGCYNKKKKKTMGLCVKTKTKTKKHLDLIPSSAIYLVKTGGFAVRKICVPSLASATY